ncbi:uncharacterized protein LOC135339658 isoform X4 [Halichondria panicea]|uniref:uncharacterized protein LOC135339658 isoform X4 n=1 Tax=Halichondria panicea TaxID=6063 RepID=UPI00312B2E06
MANTHKGHSDSYWTLKMKEFAAGKPFGRGERPRKGTKWDLVSKEIERCPKHRNASNKDVLGRLIECTCGYHKPKTSTPPLQVASTSGGQKRPASVIPGQMTWEAPAKKRKGTQDPRFVPNFKAASHRTGSSLTALLPAAPTTTLPPTRTSAALPPTQTSAPLPPTSTFAPSLPPHTHTIIPHTHAHTLPPRATLPTTTPATLPSTTTSAPPPPTTTATLPTTTSATLPLTATTATSATLSPPLTTRELTPSPRKSNYSDRLPKYWKNHVCEADADWIGRQMFVAKGKLTDKLKIWWHPPSHDRIPSAQPHPEDYTLKRLCLWAPRMLWKVDFKCPQCTTTRYNLWSKGLYHNIRVVLDFKDRYYLAAEYYECRICKGTYAAWDHRILDQLDEGLRSHFPAVLTRQYGCDKSVITLLRSRTLGNSPSALRNKVWEVHSDHFLAQQLRYLSDCKRHRDGIGQHTTHCQYIEPPSLPPFPSREWFLAVYTRDVWNRLPLLLAAATSTYGSILKIDSTKKIAKKLQGAETDTANWATNVGNERGEVLVSILTDSESNESLARMANGLMGRYELAHISTPNVLYTNRDCCTQNGPSKYQALFSRWNGLEVRLDSWHFMRRLSGGCTSKSHPLYGTFMAKLSTAIFEWDETDYQRLVEAKLGEMMVAGLRNPSESAAKKAIKVAELARHCKRRTRGTAATIHLIESLLLTLKEATDSLGVPLIGEGMPEIWQEQRHHVACLQDVKDIHLYTVTGHLTKGGVTLPTVRCARGSTSLESFHLHMARFIPGTSASAVHYQAYLLEGLTRWNAARASAAHPAPSPISRTFTMARALAAARPTSSSPFRTFNMSLQEKVSKLSQDLMGLSLLPTDRPPAKYSGELFGVEYLYTQSGDVFQPNLDTEVEKGLDGVEDEGFQEGPEKIGGGPDLDSFCAPPPESSSDEESTNEGEEPEEALDSRGIAAVEVEITAPPPLSRTTIWRHRKAGESSTGPPTTASGMSLSRTTIWRHRKAGKSSTGPPTTASGRKQYSCGQCGDGVSTGGHTQFRGQRYCPKTAGVSKEDWLASKREEWKLKQQAKT